MLYVVQLMAKKKLSHSTNNGHVYSSERLKIHPVEADNEQQAIDKVQLFYGKNKPDWKINIVDSEALIS